jgi:hypothetical protein
LQLGQAFGGGEECLCIVVPDDTVVWTRPRPRISPALFYRTASNGPPPQRDQ